MSDSSPLVKSPPAKITYSSKAKRKLADRGEEVLSNDAEFSTKGSPSRSSPSKAALDASPTSTSMRPPRMRNKDAPAPPTTSPGPKRAPRKMSEGPPSTKKAVGHFRKPSLPVSRFAPNGSEGTPSGKPMSFVDLGPSIKRQGSPSSVHEGSVAGSTVSTVKRLKESERLKILEDDETCEILDAHRVRCKQCKRTISLGPKQTYRLKPWQNHRARCAGGKATANADSDVEDDASTVAPSVDVSGINVTRRNTSEADRKAQLLADPRAEEVDPDFVLCRKCQKRIKASRGNTKYSLSGWKKHQEHCSDLSYVPGHRVAAAERRIQVVNDPQAKEVTTDEVTCKHCDQRIALTDGKDFDESKWEQHKAECTEPAKDPSATRPPASASSTEGTAVGSDPVSAGPRGVKRDREEEAAADVGKDVSMPAAESGDNEERPANRPRTEAYEEPEDSPGLLDWLFLPFKEFAAGFRQGLKPSASSGSAE